MNRRTQSLLTAAGILALATPALAAAPGHHTTQPIPGGGTLNNPNGLPPIGRPSTTPPDRGRHLGRPSPVPSVRPSTAPSVAPSALPSAIPSALPSSVPSVVPSTVPTVVPSAVPSALPSIVPSTAPTVLPSTMPTAIPSGTPH